MDKCLKIQDLLAQYRTDALSSRECRDLEEHISGCPECAAELKALDEVLALVESNVPEVEPPVGLWNGVYNRITDPSAKEPEWKRASRDWFARPVRAAGVGLVALALATGIWLGTIERRYPASPVPVQVAANNEYVQGHALYASQAPLADQVSYLSLAAESSGEAK